jgi:AcrR family transcriptional regulator
MARPIPTNPRKSASQKRSRVTVDTLLEATARVLVKQGYDRASTNRIAATAGVSIGSLYQYFPNKEALVAALVARHSREMLQLLQDALKEVASHSVATALRTLVAAMVDAHRIDPELHRIFAEQVPRMGQLAEIRAIVGISPAASSLRSLGSDVRESEPGQTCSHPCSEAASPATQTFVGLRQAED